MSKSNKNNYLEVIGIIVLICLIVGYAVNKLLNKVVPMIS
jgi:uncharacterized membrane protein (Fun14 family)